MDATTVLERVAGLRPERGFLLVGIGGHGCAGKTTLARSLPDASVVATDEFWNGAEFDLRRLRREVVETLLAGREAHFRAFDWEKQAPRPGERFVRPDGIVVIEGVCALHRMFRADYDLRVWVETPYELRLERAITRDGEAMRRAWVERWMPGEDRYVASDDPVAAADLVVSGV